MKSGFMHLIFVIDESGSMYGSVDDIKGSFLKTIEEQKQVKDGKCAVSIFRFNTEVTTECVMKDVNDFEQLEYNPNGLTAMNDGICTAIHDIGVKLAEMDESERPEKNLVVIMTDGEENASKEYTLGQVKDMIKEQTEKYSWDFMYIGTDITDSSYSKDIFDGCSRGVHATFSGRNKMCDNLNFVNLATCSYRSSSNLTTEQKNANLTSSVSGYCASTIIEYENEIGRKIK